MTSKLMAFLEARFNEDEAAARACAGNGEWDARDIAIYGKDLAPEVREHMARHDPARVLMEIEGKRRMAYLAERVPALTGSFQLFDNDRDAWGEVLKRLALPYANHPDYQDEWRP